MRPPIPEISRNDAASIQRARTDGVLPAITTFAEAAHQLELARAAKDETRAARILQSARQLKPRTAEDHLSAGFMCLEAGDYDAAHDSFDAATTLRPDMAVAYGCCALAHQLMNRQDAAAEAASIALSLDPDDLVALKVHARILLDQGRLVDVVRTCLHIQRVSPSDQDACSMLDQANALYFGRPSRGPSPEQSRSAELPAVGARSNNGSGQGLPQYDVGRPIDLDWGLTLDIGCCSYIHDCRIRNPAKAKTHIRIGKFCSIATDLTIIGYDHRTDWITTYPFLDPWNRAFWPGTTGIASQADPEIGGNWDRGDVEIGNDVWIGYNVKLFKGVKIGDGAVIGACSLVRRDVPPFTIVAGSPARVIRQRFNDADRDFLLGIKWWDWPAEKINRMLPLLSADSVAALRQALDTQSQVDGATAS